MDTYDVEVYFPHGQLFKKHERVSVCLEGGPVTPMWVYTEDRKYEQKYMGMIWIATRIDLEELVAPKKIDIYSYDGKVIKSINANYTMTSYDTTYVYCTEIEKDKYGFVKSGKSSYSCFFNAPAIMMREDDER